MNILMNSKIKARKQIPEFLDHFSKEARGDKQQLLRRKKAFYGFLPGEGDSQKLKYIKMRNSSIAINNFEQDYLILQKERDNRYFKNVVQKFIENQKEIKVS